MIKALPGPVCEQTISNLKAEIERLKGELAFYQTVLEWASATKNVASIDDLLKRVDAEGITHEGKVIIQPRPPRSYA